MKKKLKSRKIAVIGAGAWGTTLSILLAENGHLVTLWVFEPALAKEMKETRENRIYLPGFQLPENIEISENIKDTQSCDIFFFAVPTQFTRSVASQFKNIVQPDQIVVSASKGIEIKNLKLPLEILGEELRNEKLVAVSGPNLSKEIARGLPAACVAASKDILSAKTVQETLMLNRFRIYVNSDPLGTQLGGALKNVIAVAAGVADGLALGDNAKSGLIIRGMAEITRLGNAMGADQKTFAGLSGIGDLIATCSSKLSRNHCVGEEIAKGKKLEEILKKMKNVAEGVPTTKAALNLGKKYQVELPIAAEVYKVLYEGKDASQSILDLMTRSATSE
jgi:glycerol-3-phosphate dehydrogenase (NAD(P)+)